MTSRKLKVLYFAPKECWPTTTGALVRNYHLARVLARNAEVTYLSFTDQATQNGDNRAEQTNGGDPLGWCTRLIHVPQERPYTPLKLARGALGRKPVTVLNYTSASMVHEIQTVLASQDFDVVQVESVHLAAYLPLFRAARNNPLLVCDWHNIESDLMRQYSVRESNPLRRIYAQRTATQLSMLEPDVAGTVDCNVMVSEPDLGRLRAFEPSVPAFVVENGVDCGHFTDEELERAHQVWLRCSDVASEGNRNRVLFVGSMDYHANVDGIVSFARSAWLHLLELLPNARLTIAGRNPKPQVRALAELPAVEVTGTVPDMRPYYREALVSIVPLNVGGGSRLKICEAMAAGVPVVSTRLGAEGINAENQKSIIFAESWEEQCSAIVALSGNSERWKAIAAAGRELVSAKYDWTILGEQLFQIHQRLIEQKQALSANNLSASRL
jgi:polysaccharide biosynthesis protein PslH